jgi:hypothetical protein
MADTELILVNADFPRIRKSALCRPAKINDEMA